MMNEIEVIECPICMDQIDEKKNKVTTECGHCFHTSCLMKNVAHNGYGCPYCRTVMAEEPEDNNSDEEYDEFSVDEEEEGPDYNANVLRGSRWLFQRAEGEELDDDVDSESDEEEDDDRVEVEPRAPVDYIVEKLVQRGVTMADMVKSILIRDHDEYQFHDEFERADDDLFGKLRIIISNFQPQVPAPAIQVQAVEPEPEQRGYHESSRLRSHESEDDDSNDSNELEEVVDRNQIHYERFSKYYDSYYTSERVTRYEKMTAIVEEYSLEEKEEHSSIRMPFKFQMKGSCVIANNGLK